MASTRTGAPRSSGPSLERACQSSPRTKTVPTGDRVSRTTPTCPTSSLLPVTTGARRAWTILNATKAISPAITPAIAITAGSETWYVLPAGSKSSIAPSTKQTAPASVIAPWVGTNASAAKNPNASSISRRPAALIGSTCRPNRPRMRLIAPTVPGKISPGFQSSTTRPSSPIDMKRTIRFGSISVSRTFCQRDMSTFVISASFVCRTIPFGTVFVPSTLFSSAGSVGAMTSITFLFSASVAPRFDARRTAACAQAALRPWARASSLRDAAASLTTLRRRSDWMFPPPTSIGVEEPMFVCGAIASRSAAWLIQTPADAARDPGGET